MAQMDWNNKFGKRGLTFDDVLLIPPWPGRAVSA